MGLNPDELTTIELRSPNYEISAAAQGLGLMVAPEILIREDLATGRMRIVPVSGLRKLKYYAVTPKGPIRPQTRTFIEWLKLIFAE